MTASAVEVADVSGRSGSGKGAFTSSGALEEDHQGIVKAFWF